MKTYEPEKMSSHTIGKLEYRSFRTRTNETVMVITRKKLCQAFLETRAHGNKPEQS